ENTFFSSYTARGFEGFVILNRNYTIIHTRVQNIWHKTCADPLNFVWARLASGQYRRCRRLNRVNLHSWEVLLQHFTSTCNRTAGSDAGYEGIQFAIERVDRFYD